MNKHSLLAGVGALVLVCSVASADSKSWFEKARDKLPGNKGEAAQPAPTANVAASSTAASLNCPRSGATGQLSETDQLKTLLLRKAFDSATKSLHVDDIELPAPIEDVCVATKRLGYVKNLSSRWSLAVIDSIGKAKTAVGISNEVASYEAFKSDPDFGNAGDKQIARLKKDMSNDLGAIQTAINEKRVVNQVLLAEAQSELLGATPELGLTLGWDKRLVEFIGDNPNWAFNDQLDQMRTFVRHLQLLGESASAVQQFSAAKGASEGLTPAQERDLKKRIKAREKENEAYEKKLAAELQL